MKKLILFKSSIVLLFSITLSLTLKPEIATAQQIDTGADFYSTYVFRGVAFSGPSIQPYTEFTAGGLSIGAWGSQGFDGFQEMDLYASYEFDFGLSLGFTDYYYPGTPYFESDSHAFELNAGFDVDIFSFSGNYVVNETTGAGSVGDDLYFEAGLNFGKSDLFIGAGDGWHSTDGDFAIVNVGITTSKSVKINENISIPLSGTVVLNPDSEQFYILFGVSF